MIEKKTEEVRFPIDETTLRTLKRVAAARGYAHHGAMVREWMAERMAAEIHAAKVILNMDDGAGIDRNPSESIGRGRK